MKISVCAIEPFVTKDGSVIREIINPGLQEGSPMSLAEATIEQGVTTLLHLHETSHEIYHVTQGMGILRLGDDCLDVNEGDSVLIRPGTPHSIKCTGAVPLKILCCCHPPYHHDDTVIL